MEISRRLKEIGNLVIPGSRVADVGCDHAYISLYLIENNISSHIIAMDINQGPIDRARINVEAYGYKDKIQVRQSDGIKELKAGEVDSLLIAGMGGNLILKILSDSMDMVKTHIKSLVLQPQSDINLVRRQLKDFGFLITQENMIKEDGKYYVMMRAERESIIQDKKAYELTREEHNHFGRLLLKRQDNILYDFLIKERKQLDKINNKLIAAATENTLTRQEEILSMIKLVDRSLKYFHEGEKVL